MFAIYELLTVQRCAARYLTKPATRQPGTARKACLPVLASQLTERSYFVSRVSRRREVEGVHWQGGGRHKQPKRVHTSWYSVDHVDYRACSIGWDKNDVVEHSTHETREEAIAAVRQLHRTAGQVPCQD